MPLYQYVAKNREGKSVTGTIDSVNPNTAAKSLRDQGLMPTSINQTTAKARRIDKGKGGKAKIEDLVIFSRQLATMIRAGLPLIEVLNILSEQSEKRIFKTVLKAVEKDVEAGLSFTEALAKHDNIFNEFIVNMIRAGEASGMLDTILDQIAVYLEKTASLQRKIKSAVMYPLVVSIVAMAITVFLLITVVPVFEDIFSGFDAELPGVTQFTIAISNLLKNYWYIFLIVIFGTFFGAKFYYKTSRGRFVLDKLKLKLPVFGPLFMKVAVSKFSRTLSTLIRSGVNILAALEIVAKTAGNSVIEQTVYQTRLSIQSGESISKPLMEAEIFPPMVVRMIDVGERTGALESMLSKIADFYEDQVDSAVSGLTSLIEPLLIVGLGLIVGFIVISMYFPIFKLIEVVSG